MIDLKGAEIMYFFFSEIVHFSNLFNAQILVSFIFCAGFGMIFRNLTRVKKTFYKTCVVVFLVWLICEIANSILLEKEIPGFYGISSLCFTLTWVLFCFLIGALILHFIYSVLHKKEFQ